MNTLFSAQDSPRLGSAYLEYGCKLRHRISSGCVQGTHGLNLRVGEFCAAIGFSVIGVASVFGRFVCHILGVCPYEQMRRVTASGVVALVANMRAGLEGNARKQKCPPVRSDSLSPAPKVAIAIRVDTPGPGPTSSRPVAFVNVSPEQNFWWGGWTSANLVTTNKSHWNAFDTPLGATIYGGDRGIFSASALAKAIRGFCFHMFDYSTPYNQT